MNLLLGKSSQSGVTRMFIRIHVKIRLADFLRICTGIESENCSIKSIIDSSNIIVDRVYPWEKPVYS